MDLGLRCQFLFFKNQNQTQNRRKERKDHIRAWSHNMEENECGFSGCQNKVISRTTLECAQCARTLVRATRFFMYSGMAPKMAHTTIIDTHHTIKDARLWIEQACEMRRMQKCSILQVVIDYLLFAQLFHVPPAAPFDAFHWNPCFFF